MPLSTEQQQIILEHWDKMSLTELTQKVFNNSGLDGRSIEGRTIKAFLLQQGKKPKTTTHVPLEEVVLTKEAKEFVQANISPTTKPIELARIIFQRDDLEPLGKHVRAVTKYINGLGTIQNANAEDAATIEYKPPIQLVQVVKKVNDFANKDFDISTMSTLQKRNMESLKGFLHSPRFLQMINSYISKKSRNVFEQEFIRTTFDKPDLTPDELNLYLNLCGNYVLMITINRQLDMLNERYEQLMLDPDSKITTPFADMIKAKTDELNKCDKRQSELIETLNGKRKDRIKEQRGNSANIANLIEWWKEEDERIKALAWADKERAEAEEEIDRLETLSEMKARILGISKSEMLNG